MRYIRLVVIATLVLAALPSPGAVIDAAGKGGVAAKPAAQPLLQASVKAQVEASLQVFGQTPAKTPAKEALRVSEVVITNDKTVEARTYAPAPEKPKPAASSAKAASGGGATAATADGDTPTLSKLLAELAKSLSDLAATSKPKEETPKPAIESAKLTAELTVTHRMTKAAKSIDIETCLADVAADGFLSTITVTPWNDRSSPIKIVAEPIPGSSQSFRVWFLEAWTRDLRVTYRHAAPPWQIARYAVRMGNQPNVDAVAWAMIQNPTPYSWKDVPITLSNHDGTWDVASGQIAARSSAVQAIKNVFPVRVERLSVVHLPDPDAKTSPALPLKKAYLFVNDSEATGINKPPQDLAKAVVEICDGNSRWPAAAGLIKAMPYQKGKGRWPTTTKAPFLLPYAQLLESHLTEQLAIDTQTTATAVYEKTGDGGELHLKLTITYAHQVPSFPLLYLPPDKSAWRFLGVPVAEETDYDLHATVVQTPVEIQRSVLIADDVTAQELKQMVAADQSTNASHLGQLARRRQEMEDEQKKIEEIQRQMDDLGLRQIAWESQPWQDRQRAMLRELTLQIDRCKRQTVLHQDLLQRSRIEFERILHAPWTPTE